MGCLDIFSCLGDIVVSVFFFLFIFKGRFFWLRFVSDKVVNYGGFKGVFSFIKKESK